MERQDGRTELWASDPVTGESKLIEVFDHPLSEEDLRAFAVAASLVYIDDLTVEDVWALGA
ncbi:MAG TPA: hypothetical protein VF230_14765 [Acidimicrobiales bacterium]